MKNNFLKFLQSFKYAFNGLKFVIRSERNFRFHLAMAFYVIFFAIIGKTTNAQIGVLCICMALVLTAELINTALEFLCNEVTLEKRDAIMHIKDIAAASVLVCAFLSAVAGLFIFLSRDVWNSVFDTLFTYPLITVLFLISVALNLIFIFKNRKR